MISKIIIIINPVIIKRVDIFLLLLFRASGINSKIVTKIIAPAENDIINGNSSLIFTTKNAPTKEKIGSTIALKEPKRNELNLEKPSFLKGRLIALPSGKFCNAIAIVRVKAERILLLLFSIKSDPKAIPINKPSGILWIVIEEKSIIDLLIFDKCGYFLLEK